jgi:hypothetical protein
LQPKAFNFVHFHRSTMQSLCHSRFANGDET